MESKVYPELSVAEPTAQSGPRSLAGVRLEFDQVYEEWFEQVARWVRALGGPAADRDDLLQDIFVVVHRRLPDFDGQNLPGWLYQIARHRVRDFRRLSWVRRLVFGRAELPDLPHPSVSPEDSLAIRRKQLLLQELFDRLNDGERSALALFELEGLSGEQIAELEGVPLNTVWARIHSGRRKLRGHLERIERADARRLGKP